MTHTTKHTFQLCNNDDSMCFEQNANTYRMLMSMTPVIMLSNGFALQSIAQPPRTQPKNSNACYRCMPFRGPWAAAGSRRAPFGAAAVFSSYIAPTRQSLCVSLETHLAPKDNFITIPIYSTLAATPRCRFLQCTALFLQCTSIGMFAHKLWTCASRCHTHRRRHMSS